MKKTAHPAARICLTFLGILLIVVALLSSGVRLGLPLVANYKGAIESRVSEALRSPVVIGDLSLSWKGYGPVLKAEQVSVFESVERKVTLDALLIDVNLFKSFLRGVPIINELTLVGASLAIEADQAGQLSLHGMEAVRAERAKLAGNSSASNNRTGVDIMAWLITARKVGLLDTQITFIDQRADRRIVLEDLNIRAENIGDMHQLRVDVSLPEELGGTLEAGMDLLEEGDSIRASAGELYMKADAVHAGALLDLLQLVGVNAAQLPSITSLDTAVTLELWGDWQDGRLVSARGPLTTSAVVHTDNNETVLEGISATLALARSADSSTLVATDIILQGLATSVQIDSVEVHKFNASRAEQREAGWSIKANGARTDIDSLSNIAVSVLASQAVPIAAHLEQAELRGSLVDWTLALDSAKNIDAAKGVPTISMDAHLDAFEASSVAAMPGFGPLDGHINIVDSVGEVSLFAEGMALPWPAVTAQDLDLDSLTAVIGLNLEQRQRVLVDADIEADDEGINLSTRLKATIVSGQAPLFDVQSRYTAEDVTAFKQWLPRKLLSQGFSTWVDTAIQEGSASNGSILFFGKFADFPFEDGEGVFRASVDIDDGRVLFLPDWPAVHAIDATFELNGLTLTGNAETSQLENFKLTQPTLRIDKLTRPILSIKSSGSGVLQEVVEFGKSGPLKSFLEPAVRDVTGSDVVEMDIDLVVPLYNQIKAGIPREDKAFVPFSVDGSIFMSGNDVELARADLALSGVNGAIGFNQEGVRINNLKATVLGRPVSVSARTVGEAQAAQTQITVVGAMRGSDVLTHYGSQLDQFIRGASNWQVDVIAPHSAQRMNSEGVSLRATSDLIGTEVLLPTPLYKTSGKASSFELNTAFREGSDVVDWDIKLDGQAHVLARAAGSELQSLLINLGEAHLPASSINNLQDGIRVQGEAKRVAADDWVESINQLIESFPDTGGEPEPILPISASLDIESLELGTQSLGSAKIQSNTDSTYLNTVITNAYLKGNVRYPRAYWSKDIPLIARMDHVDMAVIDALGSEESPATLEPASELDPRLLPPIDARINSFTQGSLNVRDIALRALPDASGLKVTTLGFAYQSMQLVGQGYWHLLDPQSINAAMADQHVTQLSMVLQSDNFGEGLSSIGLTEVLSDGEGSVEMQLSWPGPGYLPSLDTLDGTISLQLARGNIIPLEPGAGKMMGLFALQALPRRLNLDFKDISSDGLAFKRITGEATIADGVVDVDLIQLTGPIGVVDVVGQTNLNTRELDQRVTVLPRVSAALPIIGAISGGASAGVGVLVVAGFLKAMGIDFDKIGLRDFSLTGTWDTPEFNSVATDYRRSR